MEPTKEVNKDPDGTGDPLVMAVEVQGSTQGKETCPKPDRDMDAQVSLPGFDTGATIGAKHPEQEFRVGKKERRKARRREMREERMAKAGTGISPLRRDGQEQGGDSSAGKRRGGVTFKQAPRTHSGVSGCATGSATAGFSKRKREVNVEVTPEGRPARRQKQGDAGPTYAQAANLKRQVAIVAEEGEYLNKEQVNSIRERMLQDVEAFHDKGMAERGPNPGTTEAEYLRFRDTGWMAPGFMLVTCHDEFTQEWLARWDPGVVEGTKLRVALGDAIPWPRKICFMLKAEQKPDAEVVRKAVLKQNGLFADAWRSCGVEETRGGNVEDGKKCWLLTYTIPGKALDKLREQNMEIFYQLLAIRVFRPRGRRTKVFTTGTKEGTSTLTETGGSESESD